MASARVEAPFTPQQVEALNRYQHQEFTHPFTCGDREGHRYCEHGCDFGILRATEAGWVCDDCDYTQNWAFDFMAEA